MGAPAYIQRHSSSSLARKGCGIVTKVSKVSRTSKAQRGALLACLIRAHLSQPSWRAGWRTPIKGALSM
ncbi:hypothetical protein RRG08_053144 [Elysia crispata]|uniref:Uncharacterized protein n=1 Tax=Elysia crispata TaxID=231223 RepID=A0AAE1DUI3_9GAST|nr:hypothetical protein RRG08_053144 [Elysia crispata]